MWVNGGSRRRYLQQETDRLKGEKSPLTIHTASRRRVRIAPHIQHLTYGQIEEPSRILRDGQIREVSGVVGQQRALGEKLAGLTCCQSRCRLCWCWFQKELACEQRWGTQAAKPFAPTKQHC